jgi:hypothetical protein
MRRATSPYRSCKQDMETDRSASGATGLSSFHKPVKGFED